MTIANARVPAALLDDPSSGELRNVDIVVADGVVESVLPAGTAASEGPRVDAEDGLVLPCFADIHTHLDKGHIWPRRANPDGTWLSALMSVAGDRTSLWNSDDVERRMDFSLRAAYAHGTAAIRTHRDSIPPQHEISWELFERMRERWAGRIELQAVALVSPDVLLDPRELDLVARRAKAVGGIMGGAVHVHPESRKAMFAVVEKAGQLGLDLDIHADEVLDSTSSVLSDLADAVLETGYGGKVLAGHCCALSVQDEATRQRTIERVHEAGIAVVSLPMCNAYLMDRDGSGLSTPWQRGVTRVKELVAAGVPLALASDNTRDPFYAYGDLDMVEVLREGARIIHFDHPQSDAWRWARKVTADAADICSFKHKALIAPGLSADFVLFRARTWTEFHCARNPTAGCSAPGSRSTRHSPTIANSTT